MVWRGALGPTEAGIRAVYGGMSGADPGRSVFENDIEGVDDSRTVGTAYE